MQKYEHNLFEDLEINNLPNRLTILRVLLIPLVLFLLFISSADYPAFEDARSALGWSAAWIFALASFTDFLDGYIARKRKIVTVFGSFLDPIADKFLTVSCLIMLLALNRINVFIVIILVLREMYMTSLRLLALNEGVNVPVNQIGKWKTAAQMVGIPLLMCNENWYSLPLPLIGHVLIYSACILSLWSATHYTFNMITKLKMSRFQKKMRKKNKESHES